MQIANIMGWNLEVGNQNTFDTQPKNKKLLQK